jgi:hypothetical protein
MKTFLKIFLITIASLILLLIITAGIASWYVFTPEKLTPIVSKQTQKYISCQTEIGKVKLTVFSTFPRLGIKVENVLLINPFEGAPSDTLASIGEFTGFVDIEALRKRNEIILSELVLKNSTINAYIDSLGKNNYDIFLFDTQGAETGVEDEYPFGFVNTGIIKLQNINLAYMDVPLGLITSISNLNASLTGILREDKLLADVDITHSTIYIEQNEEVYFADIGFQAKLPASVMLSEQSARLDDAFISINDMDFSLSGTVKNDVQAKNLLADVDYQTMEPLLLESLMDMVPPTFKHFFEGIVAEGIISSAGNIVLNMLESDMPVLDMYIEIDQGKLEYTYLPWPLRSINGNIRLHTDLIGDENTYLVINRMNARTPHSSYSTSGQVNNLFSDIHLSLNTTADVSLDEFNPLVPENMNLVMDGRIEGRVASDFSLSQMMELQFDQIKLSGKMSANSLDVSFDSLWVNIDDADFGFALPNPYAVNKTAEFVFADIDASRIKAGEMGLFETVLENAQIMFEASDLRDTIRIPEFLCSFKMDHLEANMDTISLNIDWPAGSASIVPVPGKSDHPQIMLAYNSEKLTTKMGQELLHVERIHLDTEIENDKSQTDFFQKWLINGFLNVDNGLITSTQINYPVEIPAIQMDFEPEHFDISDSRIIIDNSDFKLTGSFDNVLSYFRGDSILQGNFNFISSTTDLMQLMTMTSGIGVEEDKAAEAIDVNQQEKESQNTTRPDDPGNNEFTGPYMVPEGIDILLTTSINNAIWGPDTATNIRGDVRIRDGILLLDEIMFTTPAAHMQMTAMYRTPRKNHLFLGLDYHMIDIEIERLLQMIPEIDSIMPMLRSFQGSGEYHMAIESYLDSTYTLKMSTLRGAASIRGRDLVLMDGETFSEIASTLRFSKKAENRVDSLSAEFTIFRNEIDVYPFLIVMDRYEAVVGGRHNLDMSFNYHISLVNSPLPVRLGIDVSGTMDNLSYRLASPRYAELYRPVSRGVVAGKQLELRQLIREALLQGLEQ